MVKKFLALLVLGLVAVPVSLVHAASVSPDELLENIANAGSVDFTFSVDVTANSDQMTQPVTAHVRLDGAYDTSRERAAFDGALWYTDDEGAYHEANGATVLTSDTIYFSGSDAVWYYLTEDVWRDAAYDDDAAQDLEEVEATVEELFSRGVITYQSQGFDVMRGTMTMRYAYVVNTDALVAYLVDEGVIPEEDEAETRAMLAKNVTISGHFWVDIGEMLPVMMTLNIGSFPTETSYTTIESSLLFNSFNEQVDVDVPTDATDIEDYRGNEEDALVIAGISETLSHIDTDGDGLTDNEESSTWRTNALSDDTDGDGYADYTEVVHGYNPNGSGKLDSDRDGLTDYNEMTIHWSNRFDADSDDDGYNDGLEIANGYNPNGPGRW